MISCADLTLEPRPSPHFRRASRPPSSTTFFSRAVDRSGGQGVLRGARGEAVLSQPDQLHDERAHLRPVHVQDRRDFGVARPDGPHELQGGQGDQAHEPPSDLRNGQHPERVPRVGLDDLREARGPLLLPGHLLPPARRRQRAEKVHQEGARAHSEEGIDGFVQAQALRGQA